MSPPFLVSSVASFSSVSSGSSSVHPPLGLALELKQQYRYILDDVQEGRFSEIKYDSRVFGSIGRDHFLDSPQNLSLLFSNAQHIVNKFPEGRIVGLGQSPAWILEAAKRLDHAPDRFSNVAFSGSWYNSNLQRDSYQMVSLEKTMQYRGFLTECKLTPSDIIKDPIILVEHTHSGKGLKSFLDVLIEWGRELGIESQLRNAVHVHIIVGEDMLSYRCPRTSPSSLLIKSGQTTSGAFVVAMSNSADDLDRLIPHYACHEWNTPPNFRGLNQTGIDLISRRLNEYFELVSTRATSPPRK